MAGGKQLNGLGDFEKQSRSALRRVPGLSTELTDVKEVEYRAVRLERVVLVGVWHSGTLEAAEASMLELARLASTAGSVVVDALIQRRSQPDPATYVGAGKAERIAEVVRQSGADTVICDGELSLGQLRNLEDLVKVRVVDRTWLILDIFAQHARSREGKAQVSLAQLEYLLPRLRGWGETLSRQAGRIGTRGPGETKIESDRRRVRDQMVRLRRQLRDMTKARRTQSQGRRKSEVPAVVIVGYTNAGKSSLLNRLTNAGVLVDDSLFATLDPTVRSWDVADFRRVTLTDTVGFVRHLPHQLVEAFRSTLEEVADADLLLHVVDASDPQIEEQIQAVRTVLGEVGAAAIPTITIFNKSDLVLPTVLNKLLARIENSVAISVSSNEGIEQLEAKVVEALSVNSVEVEVLVPYARSDLISQIHSEGNVLEVSHTDVGTRLKARVPQVLAAKLDFEMSQTSDAMAG